MPAFSTPLSELPRWEGTMKRDEWLVYLSLAARELALGGSHKWYTRETRVLAKWFPDRQYNDTTVELLFSALARTPGAQIKAVCEERRKHHQRGDDPTYEPIPIERVLAYANAPAGRAQKRSVCFDISPCLDYARRSLQREDGEIFYFVAMHRMLLLSPKKNPMTVDESGVQQEMTIFLHEAVRFGCPSAQNMLGYIINAADPERGDPLYSLFSMPIFKLIFSNAEKPILPESVSLDEASREARSLFFEAARAGHAFAAKTYVEMAAQAERGGPGAPLSEKEVKFLQFWREQPDRVERRRRLLDEGYMHYDHYDTTVPCSLDGPEDHAVFDVGSLRQERADLFMEQLILEEEHSKNVKEHKEQIDEKRRKRKRRAKAKARWDKMRRVVGVVAYLMRLSVNKKMRLAATQRASSNWTKARRIVLAIGAVAYLKHVAEQTHLAAQQLTAARAADAASHPNEHPGAALAALYADSERLQESLDELDKGVMCPITHEPMVDPVVTALGMTYERRAIEKWLEAHTTDPLTGALLPSLALLPNAGMRGMIESVGRIRLQLSQQLAEVQASINEMTVSSDITMIRCLLNTC